ncbi:hypothetical protein E2C01_098847 [Portunus trituberculatus]|uniref:Uncharacterized protein n=1 Tax=Portunus trituberculatus TaxID=210409 RepID=A0A5B7JYT1_PORTR|nr:hypothetical protein [Portunus trituberculatus]
MRCSSHQVPPPPPLTRQLVRSSALPALGSSSQEHLKHLNGVKECVFNPTPWSHVHSEALAGCTREGLAEGRRGHQVTVNTVMRGNVMRVVWGVGWGRGWGVGGGTCGSSSPAPKLPSYL